MERKEAIKIAAVLTGLGLSATAQSDSGDNSKALQFLEQAKPSAILAEELQKKGKKNGSSGPGSSTAGIMRGAK